ncbi:MAG TPA: hypothetical protein PKV93_01195 [Fervidobacterium sp.]|nr:hypothetical protein [Fervidobacterium sp.]
MRSAYIKVFSDDVASPVENPSADADAELYLSAPTTEYVTSSNVSNYKIIVDGNNYARSGILITKLRFVNDPNENTIISNVRMYISGTVAKGAAVVVSTASSIESLNRDSDLSLSGAKYYADATDTTLTTYYDNAGAQLINPSDTTTYLSLGNPTLSGSDYLTDYILFQLRINETDSKISTTTLLQNVTITFLYDEETA